MVLRLVNLTQVLIETRALAPARSLVGSNPLLAGLPVVHVVVLALTQAPLGPTIVLGLLRNLFDILLRELPFATIYVLFMAALHVRKAGI